MPLIDLADDVFVAAAPDAVARVVHDPASWARWWPDLELVSAGHRGVQGHRWTVCTRGTVPALAGTAEVWLEAWGDGVVVHHYLRLDPVPPCTGPIDPRWAARQRHRRTLAWKRHVHRLKDVLEHGRTAGDPANAAAG